MKTVLLMDVGNTQTEVGIFSNGEKMESWRFSSKLFATEDEIASLIRNFLKFKDIELNDISSTAISSVVPELSFVLSKFTEKYLNHNALIVSSDIKLPIEIEYQAPENVGADRICAAVAAFDAVNSDVIVLDFGTATTFDVINSEGKYLGGVITLGIESIINTLHQKASKLPQVNYEIPVKKIGFSTETSIQSGVFHGNIHLVNGLLDDIKFELNAADAQILTTGGLSKFIHPHIRGNTTNRPDLVLDGLQILLDLNR